MSTITPVFPEGVRRATAHDWQRLATITAAAFHEDPVMNWTLCGSLAIPDVFEHLARDVYLRRGQCYLAGDQGATMWLGPGASKRLPLASALSVGAKLLAQAGGRAIARTYRLDRAMARARPKEPHMYLFAIGVLKAGRGKGLGGRLLRPVLGACDEASLPVYLENSNPDNHRFYVNCGFEPTGGSIAPHGAPPLTPMWRSPR